MPAQSDIQQTAVCCHEDITGDIADIAPATTRFSVIGQKAAIADYCAL
jgi:hypothetical protein